MFEDAGGGTGGTGGTAGGTGTGGSGSGGSAGGAGADGGVGAGGAGAAGGHAGGAGTGGVDEDRIVDKVWGKIRGALGGLLGEGQLQVDDGAAGGDGAGDEGHQHQSGAQVEDDTERKVREILGRVHDEQEHEHEHKTLRELAEASPVSQTRTYKALFGAGKR